MTEKRYYYDDPLAAAWMARYFGMKFTECFANEYRYYEPRGLYSHDREDTAYIHPDSVPLLEPQVGDFVSWKNEDYYFVDWVSAIKEQEMYTKNFDSFRKWIGSVKNKNIQIIQRNGLVFHFPKEQVCQK